MAETIEEMYEPAVTRKVVRTSLKIEEKSSSTRTTTMTTPAKLFGRELSVYDEVDVDELLSKLTQEELSMLAKEVDPDDNCLPPSLRTNYACEKDPTGPLNRKKLIEHINKQALETPDRPEVKPYVAGVVRGKKWIPPPQAENLTNADEQITIDLGDEYEQALTDASQEEIIDLAAILGFHSMMNQDQYHASLLNKGQPVGLGWDGITKATKSKVFPMDPPNDTDPDDTVKRVQNDDQKLTDLNWNNIKNISDEKFEKLFESLKSNTHLEVLSLVNVGLNDRTAQLLADALQKNTTLRVVNVETNFISPPGVVQLVKALLTTNTVEEFRASNQRSQVLGNKIEMEITSLVEQNPTLLRLGLHLEYSDARHRVASHLQRNIDRNCRVNKRASASLRLRLPRGRPPAVGVDASFFNLTPPSAEALTPTKEDNVITETVEQSIVVQAKETVSDNTETITDSVTNNPETVIEDRAVTEINVDSVSELPNTQTILPDETPIITDKGSPVTETDNTVPSENTDRIGETPVTGERVIPVDLEGSETELTNKETTDKITPAERPDYNPNPHSTPAAPQPEQRLDPSS